MRRAFDGCHGLFKAALRGGFFMFEGYFYCVNMLKDRA